MKVQPKIKREILKVFNKETKETYFLVKTSNDDEWIKLSEDEYNKRF